MSDQPAVNGDETPMSSAGDEFESFYGREYAATVRLAAFLSGDRSIAEDIAQDAFIRLQGEFPRLTTLPSSSVGSSCSPTATPTARCSISLPTSGAPLRRFLRRRLRSSTTRR